MNSNKLQEIREKLNYLIENEADPKDILKLSVELDLLIENYMENQKNEK